MNWSLLPTISAPMPLQMVLDELLFETQKRESQAPALRFYVSSEPWISAGCSFRDAAALSKSALILKNPQVPVCRRITGGGCVLHSRDLIFSLIARYNETPSPLSYVSASYGNIHEGVKKGLEFCGLDTKFYAPEDALIHGNDCFDFPVKSDLSWKDKKVAGGAQKRSGGVLLHQESILIPPGVERVDLIRAIRKGLETVFEATIRDADLDPEIFLKAERKAMSREPWVLSESFSSGPGPQATRS
jgi:lipoate-protein ligase A